MTLAGLSPAGALIVRAGEPFALQVGYVDEAGNLMDLTGRIFVLAIRYTDQTSPLLTINAELDGLATTAVAVGTGEDAQRIYDWGLGRRLSYDFIELTDDAPLSRLTERVAVREAASLPENFAPQYMELPILSVAVSAQRKLVSERGRPGFGAERRLYDAGLIDEPTTEKMDERYRMAGAEGAAASAAIASEKADEVSVALEQANAQFGDYDRWLAEQKILAVGTIDDPDSFNANGGSTGDLGYYPVTLSTGEIVYLPSPARIAANSAKMEAANRAALSSILLPEGQQRYDRDRKSARLFDGETPGGLDNLTDQRLGMIVADNVAGGWNAAIAVSVATGREVYIGPGIWDVTATATATLTMPLKITLHPLAYVVADAALRGALLNVVANDNRVEFAGGTLIGTDQPVADQGANESWGLLMLSNFIPGSSVRRTRFVAGDDYRANRSDSGLFIYGEGLDVVGCHFNGFSDNGAYNSGSSSALGSYGVKFDCCLFDGCPVGVVAKREALATIVVNSWFRRCLVGVASGSASALGGGPLLPPGKRFILANLRFEDCANPIYLVWADGSIISNIGIRGYGYNLDGVRVNYAGPIVLFGTHGCNISNVRSIATQATADTNVHGVILAPGSVGGTTRHCIDNEIDVTVDGGVGSGRGVYEQTGSDRNRIRVTAKGVWAMPIFPTGAATKFLLVNDNDNSERIIHGGQERLAFDPTNTSIPIADGGDFIVARASVPTSQYLAFRSDGGGSRINAVSLGSAAKPLRINAGASGTITDGETPVILQSGGVDRIKAAAENIDVMPSSVGALRVYRFGVDQSVQIFADATANNINSYSQGSAAKKSYYDSRTVGTKTGGVLGHLFKANGVDLVDMAENGTTIYLSFAVRLDSGSPTFVQHSTSGAITNLVMNGARGSAAAREAVQANDQLGGFAWYGWGGTAFQNAARLSITAIETTPSDTAMGTRLSISLPPAGSVTPSEILRLEVASGLSLFGANPVIDGSRFHRQRNLTVGALPTPGTAARTAFASNGCAFNGSGVMEAPGAGTGVLVNDNGTAWKVAGTNVTVAA